MPGGRPLKFQELGELQEKIDAYFADCDPHPVELTRYVWHKTNGKRKVIVKGVEKEIEVQVEDRSREPYTETYWGISDQKPYTITGLANFLETSRRTLIDYEEHNDEFSHTIKAAKDKCEGYMENHLFGANVTGIIFNLKNNYGWRDKQEVEHSGSLNKYEEMTEEELQAELDSRS